MRKGKYSVKMQRLKYEVSDFLNTSLAFFLFNIYRYHALRHTSETFRTLGSFIGSPLMITEQIVVPLAMMCIYALSGYYNHPVRKGRLAEFSSTFFSALTNTALFYIFFLLNDTIGMRRLDYLVILVLFGLLFILPYLGRIAVTSRMLAKLRRHEWTYSTLIVGNSRKARSIYKRFRDSDSIWNYEVVGFIRIPDEEEEEEETSPIEGLPVWDMDHIEQICLEKSIDQIILTPKRYSERRVMNILNRLFPLGIPVKIVPDTLSFITGEIKLNDILGIPLVDITSPRMSDCQTNIKRTLDVVLSSLALTILSPLLLWIAIKVKTGSKGPVIYRQQRVGRHQKPFEIYKFRSMCVDSEVNGPQLTGEDDPRITKFGKTMRKYRLDELPQFWNVIKGDMSLVGPRPERAYYIEKIMARAPYFCLVFQVRPGITSWGMVKFGYAANVEEMVERSRYELVYLNNMSLQTDAKIMIYTIKTIFHGEGK